MAYPRSQRSRAFKLYRASSGTISITTSWALVDAAYTITLGAQVGDVIEMIFEGSIFPGSAASFFLDYEIGGVRQGDATTGSWKFTMPTGWYSPANPHWFHTVVAPDVSSGTITVKPWVRGQVATTFQSDPRPQWYAKNLGPSSPY